MGHPCNSARKWKTHNYDLSVRNLRQYSRRVSFFSHCIRDPPKNLQELYQLFEKYAKSEELHQRKVESQRKPKDAPQSSRTWTRTPQPDSGRDGRSQQQVHNIANQQPAADPPRRQEYPPRAAETELVAGAEGARSRRAGSTAFSTAKTAPTKP